MRTWRTRRPIAIANAVSTVAALLWLLLAAANPVEESVAPDAGSHLAQELADLLIIIQEEASVSCEPSQLRVP
ncbi:exported hypothetical protein [Candidatus Nitrospira nitrificans]|uniref:Uncharacterized protein n=1 Tax=Candidatus Nitrospira nitrificans TaxID=1742973 RepID=A0A0S4L2B1_9BACT|nr:exported hypothetical protein [Candidatus Nitrospira nitrificans]